MQLKAWVIALNPENPVAGVLKEVLSAQNIDAAIFPAVDGRVSMPPLQDGEKISQSKALLNRRATLSSSEVGCYLSHYRLIRSAYDQGLDKVCIFEDDVVAEPGLGELLQTIASLDENAHLVRLMSLRIRKRKVVRPLTGNYSLVRPLRGALGTQGYVLNRIGMKKILEFGSTICMPIDKLYDSFFLYELNCFSVEPHAIVEISRQSNIIKTANRIDRRLPIFVGWHIHKIYRSIKRRIHYLRNIGEFNPAASPKGNPGKSERIR